MSHEVETMAWTGEVPWHGLGHQVAGNLTAKQMLKAAQLDWSVSKRPLFTTKLKAGDDGYRAAGTEILARDHQALVRDSDNRVLDVVGHKYVPVQNEQALDFFKRFIEAGGATMETAGSLCGGSYVWGLAKLKRTIRLGKGSSVDEQEQYLLLMSPHVHGKSLVTQTTTVRVVCRNTLGFALGEKLTGNKDAYRMPHVREFTEAMQQEAVVALGLADHQVKEYQAAIEFLASTKAKPKQVDDYFKTLLGLDDESLAARQAEDDAEEQRTPKALQLFRTALEQAPGADLPSAKGTWWGALNAVTFVQDHQLGKDRDKVVRDLWLGYRGSLKRQAFTTALELAGA